MASAKAIWTAVAKARAAKGDKEGAKRARRMAKLASGRDLGYEPSPYKRSRQERLWR